MRVLLLITLAGGLGYLAYSILQGASPEVTSAETAFWEPTSPGKMLSPGGPPPESGAAADESGAANDVEVGVGAGARPGAPAPASVAADPQALAELASLLLQYPAEVEGWLVADGEQRVGAARARLVRAFGLALAKLVKKYPQVVSVDGDVKNSTFAEIIAQESPDHYFEMFIAEQNMIGVATGLANRGKIPFASSFSAFLTRGFDQIRMAAVSKANIKIAGSHVGCSIGQDGASQMGLEDIAMMRSIQGSTVLYPADGAAAERLVEVAINTPGIVYLRLSRPAAHVLYDAHEEFVVGGSKVLRRSKEDAVTLIGGGVTLYEALKAHKQLMDEGISTRVIDLYSIKPIDEATLRKAAQETQALIVVEDHWYDGGMGDAVLNVFAASPAVPIIKMAVTELPDSGAPEELMAAAGITAEQIVARVKGITGDKKESAA